MKRILLLGIICLTILCGCKRWNLPEPGRYEEPFPEESTPTGESIDIDGLVAYSNEIIGNYFSEWIPVGISLRFQNCDDEFQYIDANVSYRQITGKRWYGDIKSIFGYVTFKFPDSRVEVIIDEERDRFSWDVYPIEHATTDSWTEVKELFKQYQLTHGIEDCEFEFYQNQTGWDITYYPYHRHFEINTETQEVMEILD